MYLYLYLNVRICICIWRKKFHRICICYLYLKNLKTCICIWKNVFEPSPELVCYKWIRTIVWCGVVWWGWEWGWGWCCWVVVKRTYFDDDDKRCLDDSYISELWVLNIWITVTHFDCNTSACHISPGHSHAGKASPGAHPTSDISIEFEMKEILKCCGLKSDQSITTITLPWRVQNFVVFGKALFKPEHYKIWSDFEFDRNIINGMGACRVFHKHDEESYHLSGSFQFWEMIENANISILLRRIRHENCYES